MSLFALALLLLERVLAADGGDGFVFEALSFDGFFLVFVVLVGVDAKGDAAEECCCHLMCLVIGRGTVLFDVTGDSCDVEAKVLV